jgi:LDH2 family malate/lactate/ureidoglycolate dehydrogenase
MPGISSMRVGHAALTSFCQDVLVAVGLDERDAATVAGSLVAADLRGVATHGVLRLPVYVERMRRGLIATRPDIHVVHTGPATATVDGGNGPGQVVALRAMREAVELAETAGVGLVSVRHSNHFGAAGWFALHAAERGMIGLALTHAEADVVPFGGRRAALGTNPLAVAVPRGDGPPVLLDMATSGVAMGKVLLARKQGRPIPDDWAVDAEGEPTTDPGRVRAVRPLGGPKGYGLAFVVEVLAGLLSGSRSGTEVRRLYHDFDRPQEIGHLLGAIDPARFVPPEAFAGSVDRLAGQLKATPPAPGFDAVLLTGEPEERAEARHRCDGVPVPEELGRELAALGEAYGVRWPG